MPDALFLLELDFEKFRPELAGHEEAVARFVVGDAVQDGLVVRHVARLEQPREVDPALDLSGLRVDARDAVLVPDVRVNLALHVFELVQLKDGPAVVRDVDRALDLVRARVDEAYLRRAVAEDERVGVVRQAPAFAGVCELAGLLESLRVVDEALLALPGEL